MHALVLTLSLVGTLAGASWPQIAFYGFTYGHKPVERIGVATVTEAGAAIELALTEADLAANPGTIKAASVGFSPDGRRFAMLIPARQVASLRDGAVKSRLVVGDTLGGGLRWALADQDCASPRCFENVFGFTPDGKTVITQLTYMHFAVFHAYDLATLTRSVFNDERKGIYKRGLEFGPGLLSPDGRLLLFMVYTLLGGNYDYTKTALFLREVGKQGPARKLAVLPADPIERPVWHDGKRIVSVVYGGDETIQRLVVDRVDEKGVKGRIPLHTCPLDAQGKNRGLGDEFELRGELLFFLDAATTLPAQRELLAVPIAGGEKQVLLTGCGDVFAVSADGRFVACVAPHPAGTAGPVSVWLKDRQTGASQRFVLEGFDRGEIKSLAFLARE